MSPRDFYYGDVEIKTSDPLKKIQVILKKRPAGSELPAVERNDGLIVATCERALSERLQHEAETSGLLSINKEAVPQVYDEMYDCVTCTLRLIRWGTGAAGGPNPIRTATPNYFVWSFDGTNWKLVRNTFRSDDFA